MTLTHKDWEIYALIRNCMGKKQAETYKQKRFASYRLCNPHRSTESAWNIVKWDDDGGYLCKQVFDHILTEEEQETIREAETMCIYSYYDCTGKPFTAWIEFYHTAVNTHCYHRICIDV